MHVNFFTEYATPQPQPVYRVLKCKKSYGFFRFLWDAFLVVLTCGFWLIWIFIREMRK